MVMHEFPEVLQGTEEWHDQRRGMVTASAVGQLLSVEALGAADYLCPTCLAEPLAPCLSQGKGAAYGTPIQSIHRSRTALAIESRDKASALRITPANSETSRGLAAVLVAERITGFTDPTYVNADMWRGIDDEPRAREVYAEKHAPVEVIGFMVRDDWGFEIGYSPDGLVGHDGLIEIKSRRQKKQLQTILADEVPTENMAQLQCGLLVSGRKWIDYVSYCGGMPLFVKRVLPDPQWFEAILAAVTAFEETAVQMTATYNRATQGLARTERVLELEMSL